MNQSSTHSGAASNEQAKVALITGAARRIGATTARHLHHNGYKVVIHYSTSVDAAQKLASELNLARENSAATVCGDLLNAENYQRIATQAEAAFGGIDLLVNNASSFYPTRMGEITEQSWDDLLATNLKAPLFLSQALLPSLKTTRGCIINMIDIHGSQPLRDHPVYCAAKAGLKMLTLSMAKDLGPQIRVNGIAPGAILWPENDAELDSAQQQSIVNQTALKRAGSPTDIAEAIVYLASAEYVTGQILAVDGGRSLN